MTSGPSTVFSNGETPNTNDIVIALMGMSGSGKSSLVSFCTDEGVEIGHDLQSCTQDVYSYAFCHSNFPSGRVYLVDTPGFDDTNRSDTEVLRTLAAWLTATYSSGIKLSGILYLHRINQTRMQGSALKNLALFRRLCGDDALKRVILVTTMWDITQRDIAESREKQLKETDKYWGRMIAKGSQVLRHDNTQKSAFALIESFIKSRSKIILTIQSEMVDDHKTLEKTDAGNDIKGMLAEQNAQLKKEIQNVESDFREALRKKDEELVEVMKQLKLEHHEALQQVLENQQRLQATMQQLHESKSTKLKDGLKTQRQSWQSKPPPELFNIACPVNARLNNLLLRDLPDFCPYNSALISPDGSYLAIQVIKESNSSYIALISIKTGKEVERYTISDAREDRRIIAFSSTSQTLALGSRDDIIKIRRGEPEIRPWYTRTEDSSFGFIPTISTDLETIAEALLKKVTLVSPATGMSRDLKWDAKMRGRKEAFPFFLQPVFAKQDEILICYISGLLHFWDTRSGDLLLAVNLDDQGLSKPQGAACAVSNDSLWLAFTRRPGEQTTTSFFRLSGQRPKLVRTIQYRDDHPFSSHISLSFDGAYFASCNSHIGVIFHVLTGRVLLSIDLATRPDSYLNFFPCDNRILIAYRDGYSVWEIEYDV